MLPEHILDEILISEVINGIRDNNGQVPADVSDVDGTNSVNQGLIQLELAIGDAFPERNVMIERVKSGWQKYKLRRGNFSPVIREAVEIIPDLFRGLKRVDVQALAERVAEREACMTYAFPRRLYRLLRERAPQHRRLLIAITGSPHDYAVPFCKALGFDVAVGCWMEVDEQGRYTGRRDERPAIDKAAVMGELEMRRNLKWAGGIALGDSPTDIPMFKRCTYRIAINPTMDLQAFMRETPGLRISWINDHQKTGVQAYAPRHDGLYMEVPLHHVLPPDLATALPSMPGSWTVASQSVKS